NAIVGAIGNANVDEAVLVAAIRADIERSGGVLALIAADYARRTGDYATAANVTSAQTAIIDALPDTSDLSTFDPQTDTVTLASTTHTGAVIPTVTTLTNAPSDSAGVTTLLGRLTAARAGYLDTLNGLVATIWSNVADSAGVTTL